MKNKNFGKIISEKRIELAPYPLRTDKGDVYTNNPAIYLEHGWKENIYTEQPEHEEGYYFEYRWTENDTQNIRVWDKKEIPEENIRDTDMTQDSESTTHD